MNIKNELEAWAKETVKAYNQFCLSYYTQSPLNLIEKDNIELLVLGINPGSESVPFNDWSWRNQKCPNGLSYDVFLLGNPPYQEMRDGKIKAWSYWNKLCNILNEAGLKDKLNDPRSFVLTNIYYGSTKKAKEIKGFNELKDHAFKLIDILKPKRIICLGQKVMDAVLEEYVDKNERDCFVEDLPIRYKLIPVRNEENHYMKVFGFHHPAYPYTRQEKELVGKFLGYYGKDISNMPESKVLPTNDELQRLANAYRDRIKNKPSASKPKASFNYTKLIDSLIKERDLNLCEDDRDKTPFMISTKNDMAITIRLNDIGIRRKTAIKGKGWVTDEMKKTLLNKLEELNWEQDKKSPNSWLAHLKCDGLSEEKICKAILNTIKSL